MPQLEGVVMTSVSRESAPTYTNQQMRSPIRESHFLWKKDSRMYVLMVEQSTIRDNCLDPGER